MYFLNNKVIISSRSKEFPVIIFNMNNDTRSEKRSGQFTVPSDSGQKWLLDTSTGTGEVSRGTLPLWDKMLGLESFIPQRTMVFGESS